jgi:fructosamine-3-kinase
MTELFGGFAAAFYAGYREVAPAGDPDAREVYNLYHLINHLTHGPGYAGAVECVLRRYA